METKIKKMKIERRGPDSEPKWGILKYLSAEFFTKNQSRMAYECRVKRHVSVIGQKLGYDRCPYLSFFVRRFEDENFDLTSRRDLNTSTPFLLKMLWMLVM